MIHMNTHTASYGAGVKTWGQGDEGPLAGSGGQGPLSRS